MTVKVRGVGIGVGFVGSFAWLARKDIIRRDIDNEDGAGAGCLSYATSGGDVQSTGAVGVCIAFIREAISSTVDDDLWPMASAVSSMLLPETNA